MDNTQNNLLSDAVDLENSFQELLYQYFYEENQIDAETFSAFCTDIKDIYRVFFIAEDRKVWHTILKPYRSLVSISEFNTIIDMNHEIVRLLALLTIKAIDEQHRDAKYLKEFPPAYDPHAVNVGFSIKDGQLAINGDELSQAVNELISRYENNDRENASKYVWYRFHEDTDEDLWNRLKRMIDLGEGRFRLADEAFDLIIQGALPNEKSDN
jgi:hypothetical protein